MKTLKKIQLTVLITFFTVTTVFAQEWSKEQLEVWEGIKGGWTEVLNSDIDGLSARYHEQYQGWNNESPLPASKEMFFNNLKGIFAMGAKITWFNINPARIVVTDNAAVVDYYFSYQLVVPNESGKTETKNVSGKDVFFLVKEKGKWLLLGDMTVVNSDDDD